MFLFGEGYFKFDFGGYGVVEELDEFLFIGGIYFLYWGGFFVKFNNSDVLGFKFVKVVDCRL